LIEVVSVLNTVAISDVFIFTQYILVNLLYGSIFQNPESQKGNVQEYIYKNFQNNFQNILKIFLCSFFSMKIWDFSFSYWYKKHLKLFVWFGLCGRSLLDFRKF